MPAKKVVERSGGARFLRGIAIGGGPPGDRGAFRTTRGLREIMYIHCACSCGNMNNRHRIAIHSALELDLEG
jgi:hypothetical protein